MKNTLHLIFLFITFHINAQCWEHLDAGHSHSVGIRTNGTLWGWGSNVNGELGIGTTQNPVGFPTQIGSDTDWLTLSAGSGHTIVLKENGTLWAYGRNNNGQLGIGNNDNKNSPVQIDNDNDWVFISCGSTASYAIKSNGTLWAWGNNSSGELGIGTTQPSNIPVQIGNDNDWQLVSGGQSFAVAIKNNGTLWSFGSNSAGQLGTGTTTILPNPNAVQIGDDNDWNTVSAGFRHVIALKEDGTLWVWGSNSDGQLGFNSTENILVPIQVGNDIWQKIATYDDTVHAIKADGTLWGWGDNFYSTIGDGTTIDRFQPVLIESGSWNNIALGGFHSLAVKNDGTLKGWGGNGSGQLGIGFVGPSSTPTLITSCSTAGINELSQHVFNIYPNPAFDVINIENNDAIQTDRVHVLDMTGKVILQQQDIDRINVQHLSPGIYIIEILSSGTVHRQKFIKQ